MENRKETIAKLRKIVKEEAKTGGYQQRANLLAYAFVREIPYVKLESKINEDKFPIEGRNSFLQFTLARWIHNVLPSVQIDEIVDWLFKKYEKSEEEAA